MNKQYFICLTLFLVFSTGKCTIAQEQLKQQKNNEGRFLLSGKISLDSLTKYIHKKSGIRFSFNSVKVKGSREISFPKAWYSIEEIFQQIKKTTSLYYSFYYGYVIFQDNPHKQKAELLKINASATKKILMKPNTKPLNKKLKTEKSKKITAQIILPKDPVTQKTADAIVSTGNSLRQDTDAAKINPSPKQTATDRSQSDSVKTITVKENSIPVQLSNDIGLVDSTKAVSARSSNIRRARIKNRNDLGIQFGLQWNINIPMYGFKEYAIGTNGNNQPYNFLVPGLWISKTIGSNTNEISLLVKPEQQYLTGNKIIATSTGSVSGQDSTMVRRNTVAIKANGISAGLHYNYHLNDKWNIAGGFNFNWQHAALIKQQITRLSNGVLISDSLYGIKKSSPDWKYFQSTYVIAKLEASYNIKRFAIGSAIFMPITSIFAGSANRFRPVNVHIFIRVRIY